MEYWSKIGSSFRLGWFSSRWLSGIRCRGVGKLGKEHAEGAWGFLTAGRSRSHMRFRGVGTNSVTWGCSWPGKRVLCRKLDHAARACTLWTWVCPGCRGDQLGLSRRLPRGRSCSSQRLGLCGARGGRDCYTARCSCRRTSSFRLEGSKGQRLAWISMYNNSL